MSALVEIAALFDVEYGNQLDKNKMIASETGIHFVSRSSSELAIDGRVAPIMGLRPYEAGLITVALGGSVLSAFVQPEEFYTAQNIKVLKPKSPMTFNEKVYYCLAIGANRFRFTCHGREANKTIDKILVPACEYIPKWVHDVSVEPVCPDSIESANPLLNVDQWQTYRYRDIFDIKKGQRLTKANMVKGSIPFVGAIDSNNGYRQFVDVAPNHEGNTISVNYNGSVAEAFYQPIPYFASDDVNVLYPRFEMSALTAIFLCTLIRREKYRFNYGRKWKTKAQL